jgi:uncharacterized protein (DUF2336 family)
MLKKIIENIKPKPRLGRELTYEKARAVLETEAESLHRQLAQRPEAPPEVLYYLAENGNSSVRALVAANASTPHKADLILTEDADDEVRCELARKIARLMPDLSGDDRVRFREATIAVLEKLATDHLPKVRRILSEELKANPHVPHDVVLKLAHDADALVSVPIVEYSPLLSDEDLLELIATSTVEGLLEAVARRQNVSEPVSDALVATLDIPAVSALLANPNAQIREKTLDMILDHAEAIEPWHGPLVMRADLSLRAVRRIAGFVGSALLDTLAARNELDDETTKLLKSRLRGRIDKEENWSEPDSERDAAESEAQAAFEAGKIDDGFLDAAMQAGKRDFCIHALALKSSLPVGTVRRVLASRNAKSVTALAWKAGLSMRTAVQMQKSLGHIPHQATLFAQNGIEYPLPPEELQWHIDYFATTKE